MERLQPGLYVHVPFCSAICPYCDFAVQKGGTERRRRYLDHLLREVRYWATRWPRELGPFDTLYLGGGTPSLLAVDQLAALFEALGEELPLDPAIRVSLEANPEDVTPARLAAWRRLGVDTVSLGVQSFDPDGLRFLGRRHSPQAARDAVARARHAGIPLVALDLIYGLPEQTEDSWRRQLDAALALEPDHLSCYQLTVHGGTRFGTLLAQGRLEELRQDAQGDLFRRTHEHLAAAGWHPYEVSNFARRPEARSLHNRKYWSHAPYLGLGPSAHSFLPGTTGGRRWWNERKLSRWEASLEAGDPPVGGTEDLSRLDLALEALALGLRTTSGIDLGAFAQRFGIDLAACNPGRHPALVEAGLLHPDPGRWRPTLEGLAVADALAREVRVS